MPITVDVPNEGKVEFPDGMAHADIEAALSERFSAKPQPLSEDEFRETLGMAGYRLPASGEERAARDYELQKQGGFVSKEKPSAILGQEGPVEFVNAAMDLAGRAATGVANIPTRLANRGKPEEFQTPLLEANEPLIRVPQIEPEQMQGESKPVQVAAGVYNKLAELGTGLTSPGQALTIAAAPARLARVAFGTQLAVNIPGTIAESAKTLRDPNATLMEKGGAAIAAPAEAFMLKQIVKSAPLLPRAAKAAAESAGLTLKGVPDASSIRPPAEVHGDVRPQPLQSEGQVPVQESGPRVQPQAPEVQTQQPALRLTTEEQGYLDAERGSIDAPVQVVEGPLKEGDPFAGQIATIDRKAGQVLINPQEFSTWLKEVPEAQRATAVRSLLSEERIHLAADDTAANGYWNSLSRIEQAIERRRYGVRGLDDTALGHEALRVRLQQLARMMPREIAEASGPSKLGMQTITVLGNIVRRIRETFGTKASKEGLAILNRIQANLAMAKVSAVGQAPAAMRKPSRAEEEAVAITLSQMEDLRKFYMEHDQPGQAEKVQTEIETLTRKFPSALQQSFPAAIRKSRTTDQPEFILPNVKGKGVLSKPPTEPATTPRPELAPKPVSATELQADAAKHLAKTARPSFDAFSTAARTKYGSNLQPGQLREIWQESVWKRLESASGQELVKLRDQLGLGRITTLRGDIADRPTISPSEQKGFALESEATGRVKALAAEYSPDEPKYKLAVETPQGKRNALMSRIGEKLIAEAETGRKAWNRREVTPQEVATWRESSEGAYRDIGADELKNPESLGRSLTEGAGMERSTVKRRAAGGKLTEVRQKAPPPTVTKRLTAMLNKTTGQVELVGTYRDENGVTKLVEPSRVLKTGVRPHIDLDAALRRYRPIASVLLDEPTQSFHQSFESLRDFQDRFGSEAKQLSEESQRSGEEPVAATASEPEKGITLTLDKPLQDNEAGAVLSRIISEVGKFESPDDVRLTIAGFADEARTMPLTKLDWPAINGFAKIYDALKRKWPLLDDEQVMAQMSEEIYAIHAQPETTFDDFVARITQAYQREGGRVSKPGTDRPTEGAAAEGSPTSKELTMPIERRPPTDVRAENVPLGSLPEKKPAPPVPEGGIEGASSAPAAIRKSLASVRDRTLAESERLKSTVGALVSRAENFDRLPATYDAAQTIGNNVGIEAEWAMRIASNATGLSGTKGLQRVKGIAKYEASRLAEAMGWDALKAKLGDVVNPYGRKEVLRGTIPMTEAGAITADYDMRLVSPDGRKLFLDILKADPRIAMARRLIRSPSVADKAYAKLLIDKARSNAFGQLISKGFIRATNARYGFDENALNNLPRLDAMLQDGITKAKAKLRVGNAAERFRAARELKAFEDMAGSLKWVETNWKDADLRSAALQFRKEMDFRYQREADNGYNLRYDEDYTPGRYEGNHFNDGRIFFPGVNVLGKEWRKPKTFSGYYEAAQQGYVPATQDAASIVGHRARQGERAIQYKMWTEGLKSVTDPQSGLQVSVPLVNKGGKYVVPSQDYVQMTLRTGYEPVGVLRSYEHLVDALPSASKFDSFAPARVLLELEQRLKHTLLIGDFFHLGRLTYYAQSIAGLKRLAGYQGGLSVLDYRAGDLPRAVQQGLISQAAADWATATIPVRTKTAYGTKATMMSRREVAQNFQREGLNVGQIQDALYKDLVGDFPIVGRWNRWLFDKYTRGLMMESAVHEFERLNNARPDIDHRTLMRDIARDTNRFFGNLGSQGWFKSRTWRDIARLGFLAPQWVEGLIMKEATLPARLVGLDVTSSGTMLQRRGDLPRLGTLGKGIGGGLLTMLAITQAVNLWTRRQPTWMNQEDGHKWDAWIPGGKNGFFLSPLSVFNELTHDLVRLWHTKPKAWDAVQQIGMNKLSPFGRLAMVLATDRSPTGEYQTTSGGVLKKAAEQVAPTPISFGKVVREGAHAIAPGTVSPNPPGAFQRQAMQWAGLKAEPASSAEQQIGRLAQRFVEASGGAHSGFRFEPTDDPSYAKMRSALRAGDTLSADKVLKQLLKSRSFDQIGKAMRLSAKRPFTGSKKAEQQFVQGLTVDQRGLYWKAQEDRQRDYESFLKLMIQQR